IVDLIDEGQDVGVRIAHLPDSTLSAIRVGAVRRVVCASPAYLAARGTPLSPAELAHHDTISFAAPNATPVWTFASGRGTETIDPQARLSVNAADVAIAAAVAGRGLTRVLSYQVATEVAAGRLKIVLAEFEQPALPIHIVHPEGRRAAARVRALVDFAV